MRPSRMTVTRSATSRISCSLWVAITMDRPWARRARSTVKELIFLVA